MKCGYSREILALYVEDDLASPHAIEKAESHVGGCVACRRYCEQLRRSQAFIKSRFVWSRQSPVNQETLTRVRQGVLAQLPAVQQNSSWAMKLERFLILCLRTTPYQDLLDVWLNRARHAPDRTTYDRDIAPTKKNLALFLDGLFESRQASAPLVFIVRKENEARPIIAG